MVDDAARASVMTTISYAQNAEDVVLNRAFADVRDGFYIDVGAAHPVVHSVTKHFYERGWHGINVEPHPGFFELLRDDRPRDVNLNVGISSDEGTMTFFEDPHLPGNSTFSLELAEVYRAAGSELGERELEVTTLARVCEQHVDRTIDFLKIDVEGLEREVIAGADFERFRPRVVVVEAIDPAEKDLDYREWDGVLRRAGYRFSLFDGINRFYATNDEEDVGARVGVPANFLDDYVPYELDECRRAAEALEVEIENRRGELAEAERSAQACKIALRETRVELAARAAAADDLALELTALRSALVAATHEAGTEEA